MRILLCLLGLLIACYASMASAQAPWRSPWAWTQPWGDGYYHSSTYEEGVQRGFADVVRSAGAYNLMTSEAMKNVEQARRQYIDNRVYSTEKYFEMRRINREARAAERGPRPTMEDLIRYSDARKPDRLSPSELDPLSGRITWPVVLKDDRFQEDRQQLEKIFAERAVVGVLSMAQLTQIDSLTKHMLAVLKENINAYPPQLYTQAKSFLQSLAYEALAQPS